MACSAMCSTCMGIGCSNAPQVEELANGEDEYILDILLQCSCLDHLMLFYLSVHHISGHIGDEGRTPESGKILYFYQHYSQGSFKCQGNRQSHAPRPTM